MTHFRFVTDWHVVAPRERVWDALLLVRDWPRWWRGFRSVEVLDPGADSGVGMRLRQRWRSLVPYTLTIDLEIERVERRHLLEGRVSGDLVGRATWTIDDQDGGTRIRFVMDARPGRWWMSLPLPLAGRIVEANYDAIMRWGGEGLGRLLETTEVGAAAPTRAAAA